MGVQGMAAPPQSRCPLCPQLTWQRRAASGPEHQKMGPRAQGPAGRDSAGTPTPMGSCGGDIGMRDPSKGGGTPRPAKAPSPGLCLGDSGNVLLRESGTYWGHHCVPRVDGAVTPKMCPLEAAPAFVSLTWLLETVTLRGMSLEL